ncbi:MAG: T9SS type A sorting domain-containing protein [Flavitalea sp.]
MKTQVSLTKMFAALLLAGASIFSQDVTAQNLVVNGGWSNGTAGWSTGCSIEINPESVYGGSGSNPVTEIDIERCFNQEISVSADATYNFSYKASRRQSGTPATVGVNVEIIGVQSGIDYINVNKTYTNTSWAYTTENFSFTVPGNTIDTRVNIKFSNYLTTGTYGTLIDDITLTVSALSSTLPVRLTGFNGQVKNNKAVLNWTASNDDNDGKYFIIERSAAQGSFDSIGVVSVAGTNYSFTDNNMSSGSNNYRLKIINLAGSTYSKIINLVNSVSASVQVYPNPATSTLSFKLSTIAKSTIKVQVYSLSGSIVTTKVQQLSAGINAGNIDVTALRTGSYYVKITDGNGMNYVQAFCKK